MDYPLPQNIVAELLRLLNRTITVIEKQAECIVNQNTEAAVAKETEKIKSSASALAAAVANQTPEPH